MVKATAAHFFFLRFSFATRTSAHDNNHIILSILHLQQTRRYNIIIIIWCFRLLRSGVGVCSDRKRNRLIRRFFENSRHPGEVQNHNGRTRVSLAEVTKVYARCITRQRSVKCVRSWHWKYAQSSTCSADERRRKRVSRAFVYKSA